jgi:hypothetical protein
MSCFHAADSEDNRLPGFDAECFGRYVGGFGITSCFSYRNYCRQEVLLKRLYICASYAVSYPTKRLFKRNLIRVRIRNEGVLRVKPRTINYN